MKNKSNYVFGAALAGIAMGGLPGLLQRAKGAAITNAAFTFEGNFSPFSTTATATTTGATSSTTISTLNFSGATIGPILAESGTGSAYGVHASASTVYSAPAGNGSPHSLSSNVWGAGDYYQFSVPTTNIQNIVVSFDQFSSSTGPKAFNFAYSIDGTNFSTVNSYSVLFSTSTITITGTNSTGGTGTSTSWNTGFSASQFNYVFNLGSIAGLNNDPNAVFELININSTSTGGTDRVDNFVVAGDPVPEPMSVTLLTAAAAGMMFGRRRRA